MSPSTSGGLTFDAPPPKRSFTSKSTIWSRRLVPLRDFPNEWVRVYEYDAPKTASVTATFLRAGRLAPDLKGRWEFKSLSVDGKGRIYARYLGE